MGHKLKRIGALAHPLRAEKDEDVVMGAHTLTGVEELLESCFLALENYTGEIGLYISFLEHFQRRSCIFGKQSNL